jgi:putative spermidine/putrescine transport system substrate-binding protein
MNSTRRRALRLAALIPLLATPVLAGAQSPAQADGVTLRIATFPGTWVETLRAQVGEDLAKKGIKLEFVPGNSVQFLAKLIAAKGQPAPFDLVEVSEENYPDFVQGGFLQKFDLARIPNVKRLDASLYDDTRISYWVSQPTIIYNVDRFKEAGIPVPKRFSDLADPRLKGRVLVPDISIYHAYYAVTALANENGGSDRNLAPGFEALKRIAPYTAAAGSSPVAQAFQSGDAWAAIWGAHVAVRLAKSEVNVSVSNPRIRNHRVAIARGYLGLVAGSEHAAAAQAFIDAALAARPQKEFNAETGMVPVNTDVLRQAVGSVPRDRAGAPLLLQAPEDIADAWWPDYAAINKREFAREYQRALAR